MAILGLIAPLCVTVKNSVRLCSTNRWVGVLKGLFFNWFVQSNFTFGFLQWPGRI